MKKSMIFAAMLVALTGCEDASSKIEQAQEAANKGVDAFQEKLEGIELPNVDLDKLGDASDATKELMTALQEVVDIEEFGAVGEEQLKAMEKTMSNAYACLVDATSESTADKLVSTVLETLEQESANSFIEKTIEKAKSAGECVGL